MTCDVIATGSTGNAVLINRSILLDCGVPFKKLKGAYGGIKVVLLGHLHSDHFDPTTIKRLHRERPSVRFACGPWLVSALIRAGVSKGRIDCFDPGEWYSYREGFKARCIPVLHDVPNCAWDIEIDGETVFYATDCGNLNGVEAPNRDLYLVEGNYKEEELLRRMQEKAEQGEFTYEARVEQYHLSEEQAMRFLSENAGPSSKYILIHKHTEK